MSATDTFENKILSLYFMNAAAANIGDASGLQPAATAGSIYVSLHEADPGEDGDQTDQETDYTNYARVGKARSASEWSVASGVADNDNIIEFATCGATGATITHFGLGFAASSTGSRDINGTASLVVSNGITPQFAAGALDTSMD